MADPRSIRTVLDRLKALQDRGDVPEGVSPGGATPEQLDAMQETMAILSDPRMLARLQTGRRAVAAGDVIPLEAPAGVQPASRDWMVVLTAPAMRELEEASDEAGADLRETLDALATDPAEQGQALGMGLVGTWAVRGASHRVLYAVHRERRLVTVISVDGG